MWIEESMIHVATNPANLACDFPLLAEGLDKQGELFVSF